MFTRIGTSAYLHDSAAPPGTRDFRGSRCASAALYANCANYIFSGRRHILTMAYSSRPTSMLPGAGLRQPSQPSSALSTRIAAKKAELENLRQLRDLSGTLAMQMQALESKIATLKDGTEGSFLPLSTTARLLICFQPLHACLQIGIMFSVPSILPPVSLRGCLSEGRSNH